MQEMQYLAESLPFYIPPIIPRVSTEDKFRIPESIYCLIFVCVS